MNGPIEEVRRLRSELAEKNRELAELRGLVQAHVEATSGDRDYDLDRERAAYERGRSESRTYEDGFGLGHDVGLCAHEEARPFVAGVREGFEAGFLDWKDVAQAAFSELHKPNVRQLRTKERDIEREAG